MLPRVKNCRRGLEGKVTWSSSGPSQPSCSVSYGSALIWVPLSGGVDGPSAMRASLESQRFDRPHGGGPTRGIGAEEQPDEHRCTESERDRVWGKRGLHSR